MEQITKMYRERLKNIMIDRLISYAELALECKIGEPTLRNLINENRRPTVSTLRKVREYFKKLDEGKKK